MGATRTYEMLDGWFVVVGALERGEFPSGADLAFGFRSGDPLPARVRIFLAELFEGKISAPPGRPKKDWFTRWTAHFAAKAIYVDELKIAQGLKSSGEAYQAGTPSEIALAATAEALSTPEVPVSEDTARDMRLRRHGY